MKPKAYIDETSNVYAHNRLLKSIIVILTIGFIFNSISTFFAMKYQKVIILPPILDKQVIISGNNVDEEYIRQFSRYIVNLVNTYSPYTAKGQFEELMLHIDPSSFDVYKSKFDEIRSNIEALTISSVFYPQDIKLNTATHVIEITGIKKQTTTESTIFNGKVIYLISYTVRNGRFYVLEINEK
ncbi:MAG TPA: type IV conjugative transfer system protein TraE [Syntrophorhabdus sp.]|jgi:conjugal transfer pilus assembly protein TraE|nr:type IV conjugative transfer system protein TraE [Syntrophorhabdus sp.]HQP54817.1 type IV conjugative transfer system protein TraE [Syntrophorhabdus sp.]